MSVEESGQGALLAGLQDLADRSLALWSESEGGCAELVNLSENATYRIAVSGRTEAALRIHREGYHSLNAIRSEIAWMNAVRNETGISTPEAIPGKSGDLILQGRSPLLPRPRNMVLFRWIEGHEPGEEEDLLEPFEELGRTTARLHLHAMRWNPPAYFERMTWNTGDVFGSDPRWGHWRNGPGVDAAVRSLLRRAESAIVRRLSMYGTGPERYGLVHADLRLANLLIYEGDTRVIDFDDCGFSWHLYDLATSLSFIEDDSRKGELIAAWLKGYESVRYLGDAERSEIPTFILFRRMALLAWTGSHAETDLASEHAPAFARATCDLAEAYLGSCG